MQKSKVINIILILAVILFFYLWISKPTKPIDNLQKKIDSLELILSKAQDSITILRQKKDSIKIENYNYFLKIRELTKDKADLLKEYEKAKGHIIHTTISQDIDIFKKHISKVDYRWQ